MLVGDLHDVERDDCVPMSMGHVLVQGVMMLASSRVVAALVLVWGLSMSVPAAGARIMRVLAQWLEGRWNDQGPVHGTNVCYSRNSWTSTGLGSASG